MCTRGCARFLRNRRMSSAIWGICRRKAWSKPAAYSRTFPPSTPGTLTWALKNQRLAKPSTCSVAGTVRCKETRTTRLCGLGGQSPPTSIPAYVMRALLTLAHSTPSLPIRRAATASVLCYAFMLRADSCVRLKHRHVSFTSQGLALQLHVKTRGRDVSTTVHRPGHDEVYHLLRDWVRMCRAPGQASLWALPDRQHDTFTSPCINRWFQASCDILGLRPPQGEKWVGHSHRSGGATAALSIDASLPAIARFGVWDHIGSLQAYLDASVGPSVDALLFFEHLLKPSLHAVREQLSAQRAQAQGLPRTYSGVLLGAA